MSRMSLGAQLALFGFFGLAAYGLFHYMVHRDMLKEIQTKTTERDDLDKEVKDGKQTAARLPEFKREYELKEARLQTLSRILPNNKEVDDLLRKVQALAAQSNLTVLRFKPEATKPVDFYAEWPISLELDGTYHNLAYFFDRIAKLSRIVNVSNLKVSANNKPTPSSSIKATCTATTFVFLEQPVAPPPAKGKKAPAKGAAKKS